MNALILALALFGAFAIFIIVIKCVFNCSLDHAVWYSREYLKDVLFHHFDFSLYQSEFPIKLKTDISSILSDDVKKKWDSLLNLQSHRTEMHGFEEGVSYYSFIIPWKDEYLEYYNSVITNSAKQSLLQVNCTISEVLVDYIDCPVPDFKICKIRYARIASEQKAFIRLIRMKDKATIAQNNLNSVKDKELDSELDKYDKNKTNNH